jgi:hypothetical protein
MVNINIPITDSLHRQLKISSITKQKTLKQYIILCLEQKISQEGMLKKYVSSNAANPGSGNSSPPKAGGAKK